MTTRSLASLARVTSLDGYTGDDLVMAARLSPRGAANAGPIERLAQRKFHIVIHIGGAPHLHRDGLGPVRRVGESSQGIRG